MEDETIKKNFASICNKIADKKLDTLAKKRKLKELQRLLAFCKKEAKKGNKGFQKEYGKLASDQKKVYLDFLADRGFTCWFDEKEGIYTLRILWDFA